MKDSRSRASQGGGSLNLKSLALHLGLTPGFVSSVLNKSPTASVSKFTRNRIFEAARQLNYRPNFAARSLRGQRTYMVGVMAEEIAGDFGSNILSGIEDCLRTHHFLFLTMAHRKEEQLLRSYEQLFLTRGVEGVITVDTPIDQRPLVPTIAIAGQWQIPGVTNIVLDYRGAARLVLKHLLDLGHKDIAFFRGPFSSYDSGPRWKATEDIAAELEVRIRPELVIQIETATTVGELGRLPVKRLLASKVPFTALFAYDDISAMNAVSALQADRLKVPSDVSVVGWGDVPWVSLVSPALTTIRWPMQEIGRLAAETLLGWINRHGEFMPEITVSAELRVRESTSRVQELSPC